MSARRPPETAPRICPSCGRDWVATIRHIDRQRGLRTYPCPECKAKASSRPPRYRPTDMPVIKPGPWVHDGSCAGMDPEVWWEDEDMAQAILICRACPVKELCLDWALTNGETQGVWGGTTPRERALLTKRALQVKSMA